MPKRQRTSHTDVDVAAAVLCGDAFYQLAQPFIRSIPTDPAEAASYAVSNIGHMSAASVNLAFALEIFLKALIAGTGKSFPSEHSLLNLFDEFRPDVQEQIKVAFDSATNGQRISDVETGGLLVEVSCGPPKQATGSAKPFPKGVRALLQRNAKNFIAWRYVFSCETKDGFPLSFEFGNLNVLAQILRSCFPGAAGAHA